MTRRDAVRQKTLEVDDYHCQITGFDGRDLSERSKLAVHHVIPIGGGGPDTVENCITLRSDIHMPYVEDKAITIDEWDREAGILKVTDHQGVLLDEPGLIPREELWFYQGRMKPELEACVTRVQGLVRLDGNVAHDIWRLWKDDGYKILEDGREMKSFAQFAASQGWNARSAARLARLYDRARVVKVDWPAAMSSTDFRRQLKEAGKLPRRAWWYMVPDQVPPWFWAHGTDEVLDQVGVRVIVKVAAFAAGLTAKRGKLYDQTGQEVTFVDLTGEGE